MTHTPPVVVAGQSIPPGETCEVDLKFTESYLGTPVSIPIFVMRAPEDGPIVYIAGVIHGDELNGMGIVRELLYHRAPELVRGTLICVPVVNILGIERHARYMPDRRDLNRSFPGSDSGSITSRLAHALFTQVVAKCDFGIDLHTAAVRRMNYPNVRAHTKDERIKMLAESFGCEVIVRGQGPKGSLRRVASEHGVPTIILEAGEVWKIEPGVVQVGVEGCLNVLKALGMIEGEIVKPRYQTVVSKTTWVRAERGGLLDFHARPGELVSAGQTLAHAQSIFGRYHDEIVSPASGIILGMSTLPMVKPGEPIYHVAVLTKREMRRIRAILAESPEDHLYDQVQEALATSVTIHEHDEGDGKILGGDAG